LALTIACSPAAPQLSTHASSTHHGQCCLRLVWDTSDGETNGKYHHNQHDFDPLMMGAFFVVDHLIRIIVCHNPLAIIRPLPFNVYYCCLPLLSPAASCLLPLVAPIIGISIDTIPSCFSLCHHLSAGTTGIPSFMTCYHLLHCCPLLSPITSCLLLPLLPSYLLYCRFVHVGIV